MMFDVCSRVLEAAGFSRLGEGNNSVNIYYCYRQERMNVVFVWDESAIPGMSPAIIDDNNKKIVTFLGCIVILACLNL